MSDSGTPPSPAPQVYMHVIPGMDAEDARLAATAILWTLMPAPERPATLLWLTGEIHRCAEDLDMREGP